MMKRYEFGPGEQACLEKLRVPLAVYQVLAEKMMPLAVSAGFCELFGFADHGEAYRVMQEDMLSTVHPDDTGRVTDAISRFAAGNDKMELVHRVKQWHSPGYRFIHSVTEHVDLESGERLAYAWYMDEGSMQGDNDTPEVRMSDSFRAALHEESIMQISHYDPLTGLPNMSYFFELAEEGKKALRSRGKTPVVLLADLNGMKFFNQKYGFAEGDKLIRAFSQVLASHFERQYCSRFGQDHFAAFGENDGLEEKLNRVIAECAAMNGDRSLPIRIGIYRYSHTDPDISTACDRAKSACDSLRGRVSSGFVYFDENMLSEIENRQYIIDTFERALEEKRIQVHYQPIVRASSGKVCDEEALARWYDPEKGVLTPAQFIPVLEDVKLIYKLDLFVLEQVLEKMKAQMDAGLYIVPISINLSRADFDCCDIVEEICCRVDGAGIARDKLNIEITESVIGSDFDFMKAQVERFRSLGFHVWMDDFGSGYSSLDVLQSIRFDLLKFDLRFMERFNESESGKIILIELTRMAISLGIDTVCEGVETQEQVDFLREIGCTKLQGFFYGPPISFERIVERHEKGIQIGFENPAESEYYAAIGRINLYDAAVMARDDRNYMGSFYNTIPMAIIEATENEYRFTRCNPTYRAFMKRMFGLDISNAIEDYEDAAEKTKGMAGSGFLDTLQQCVKDGNPVVIDEKMPEGSRVHSLLKRVAVNPVTGTTALAAIVLAVMDDSSTHSSMSFAQIANALSADYFDLFYVDMETEDFVRYSSEKHYGNLNVEMHGTKFFETSRRDAMKLLYPADREEFVHAFTKENVLHALEAQGSFTVTYRLLMDGKPVFVNMKAVRMESDDDRHIVIGVNNINVQMQERKTQEQLEDERVAYARLAALNGDYLCFYTVDPATDKYIEFNASSDYAELGLAKTGEQFFLASRNNSKNVVYREDQEYVRTQFTKEKIMREIEKNGIFLMQYRLMIDGKPVHALLKAALLKEKGGQQLIIGVSNIDSRFNRDGK